MKAPDEEFMKRLRATFKVEAEEHLQMISSTLLELEKSPSPRSQSNAVEGVFREVHSLKGAARAVDFCDVEAICQTIESVFASWKKELTSPSPEALDTLHRALDTIRGLLEPTNPDSKASDRAPDEELMRRLGKFARGLPISTPPQRPTPPAQPQSQPQPQPSPITAAAPAASIPTPTPPTPTPAPAEPTLLPVQPSAIVPASMPVDVEKTAALQTVRIPIDKLDSRLLQAEDMLTIKSMAVQRANELREVNGQFDRWQREWAKVLVDARSFRQTIEHREAGQARGPSTTAASAVISFLDWNAEYIRALENKFRTLTAQADLDRHSVGKRVDDLLEDSKKLLMLPFSTLSGIFPKIIRDLCRELGKEAELVIQGGDVEIDKRILEEMKDALIHILRNCVDHGIESPAERERLDKPARATITIAVSAVSGNNVEILVSDDGAGIDIQRVKDSAVQHGIISQAETGGLVDTDAMDLVFHSEVSTSPTINAISGRGLGMAIVRAQSEKLGGRVSIQSIRHAGTTLRIVLPLTLATFRGVLVSVADRVFVVPTVNVERVLQAKTRDIQTVENRQVISVQGRAVSLVRLDALLDLPPKSTGADDGIAFYALLLHNADQRVAFIIDEVLREEEVLVKPLRKPLSRVRNIAGVTVLGSGKTVPILNVSDLMQSARSQGAAPTVIVAAARPRKAPTKKILVAEDSITSRMLLKGILESAGFIVRTAVDGMDAFTALREDRFDLVVSDVEMPRMNGFDLTTQIRADKRTAELPVVLVSALESREERERGIDAGASAYIIKSSFDQSNLLGAVQRLVQAMSIENKIKVLIVEDSNVVRLSIAHLVNSDPGMQVIGMARNGREALKFLSQRRPDVILMDIEMPEMDGLEATRRIMETQPVPVIFCSAGLGPRDAKTAVQLLETGAVACVETPHGHHEGSEASAAHLLQTVRLMSEVKLVRRWPHLRRTAAGEPIVAEVEPLPAREGVHVIGIGASTGGPPVLKTIFEGLPGDFPVPILVVQHIARGFLRGLTDWLSQVTGIPAHIAEHGASPLPGHVYLAPDDFHMEVGIDGTIALTRDEPENGVRPSVSHLFRSLARVCGPGAVGVLLTGMGKDGAHALKRMRERGATTIAQDRQSSTIHGMPGEAIAIGAASCVLPAKQIAPALIALAHLQHHPEGGVS